MFPNEIWYDIGKKADIDTRRNLAKALGWPLDAFVCKLPPLVLPKTVSFVACVSDPYELMDGRNVLLPVKGREQGINITYWHIAEEDDSDDEERRVGREDLDGTWSVQQIGDGKDWETFDQTCRDGDWKVRFWKGHQVDKTSIFRNRNQTKKELDSWSG